MHHAKASHDAPKPIARRRFLRLATTTPLAALAATTLQSGCAPAHDPERYTQDDRDALAQQRADEQQRRGRGRHGKQVYEGYRGLAELPWFALDEQGDLRLIDDTVPRAIDVHAHLGISVLFRPQLDLLAPTERVRHLLDCDGAREGCPLDLDIYINGNFSEDDLKTLRNNTLSQGLWGNAQLRSHTIPNLLGEMDRMGVSHSVTLPIKLGLPFGDTLTEDWRGAIQRAGAGDRLLSGLSVHPLDGEAAIDELRAHAASGARMVKLHPTVQKFYPDDPRVFPLYEEAQSLNLVLFYHGGRAGIEPEDRQGYALPRHYEGVMANFPSLPVVLGHGGARDGEAMLELALRYPNAWLGIHGQGVTALDRMIDATGGERLLFGTDWPWYHIGATLAKVLLCTEGRPDLRHSILRGNALKLLPELTQA